MYMMYLTWKWGNHQVRILKLVSLSIQLILFSSTPNVCTPMKWMRFAPFNQITHRMNTLETNIAKDK